MASRICTACDVAEPIADGEAIWPAYLACRACGHVTRVLDGTPLLAPELADQIVGFDPKHFKQLAAIEDGHFWFVPRTRLFVELAERFFPKARSILEVGCGNGVVLSALARGAAGRRVVGSDLHPSGLVVAKERLRGRAEFVQMDARRIMARSAFDVICAFDVIEHIVEDEEVIASAHAALTVGGGMMVAVPQHPWMWSNADEVAHHVRRYRRGELEGKLERNGFRVVFSGSYCSLPLPLMVASRWFERLRRKSANVPEIPNEAETRPPRLVNQLLTSMLQAEVSATLAGMRFPVGGSRVAVAIRR